MRKKGEQAKRLAWLLLFNFYLVSRLKLRAVMKLVPQPCFSLNLFSALHRWAKTISIRPSMRRKTDPNSAQSY